MADASWRVEASGRDIWNPSDTFGFVHQSISGDVVVAAQLTALQGDDPWAKAGVMVRGSLDDRAAHALMSVTPSGTAEFIFRTRHEGVADAVLRRDVELPVWLQLMRQGDRLTGAISYDGTVWETVGTTHIDLPELVHAGVAVTSRDADGRAVARLESLSIDLPAPLLPAFVPTWTCNDDPPTPTFEPTLFVAVDGSDDNDGRSPERPLRTLQRAADLVAPGDVVWLRQGVYASNAAFATSGTESAPIVVESMPGECAILDGSGQGSLERLQLLGVEHMILRNLVIRRSPAEGIILHHAHDNVLSHLVLHHNHLSGILVLDGDRNRIERVVSYGNFDAPDGGNADGISISSGDSNHVLSCVTFDNSDDGVDTWRSTNTVVERCVSFGNGWQGGDGKGFKAGAQGFPVATIVRHSIAFDNRTDGFHFNSGLGVVFENNTAFANARYGFVAGSATIRHNLAMDNRSGPMLSHPAHPNLEADNSWQLDLDPTPFVSLDRSAAEFLAVRAHLGPTGAYLGATPFGVTLRGLLDGAPLDR